MSKAAKLQGLNAAPHTPFHPDGSLNLKQVELQATHLIELGVSGVFVGGSTGEFCSLQIEERLALTRRWCEVTKGSALKILVHVGSNCQRDSMTLATDAEKWKVAGIASVAPSYFKPGNVDSLVSYYAPIAAAAPSLAFYHYDIPIFTSVVLRLPEFLERGIKRIPNLAGMKYSNPDLIQLQELVRCDDGHFDIVFGLDECLLGAMALGVVGAVGATYNFAAPMYLQLISAFQAGDWETARQLQYQSVRIVRILNSFGFTAASKSVMHHLGIDCGPVRSPLRTLSEQEQTNLIEHLEEEGLLKVMPKRK